MIPFRKIKQAVEELLPIAVSHIMGPRNFRGTHTLFQIVWTMLSSLRSHPGTITDGVYCVIVGGAVVAAGVLIWSGKARNL